jgi:hypothetical protein
LRVNGLDLRPFASWTPEERRRKGAEYDEPADDSCGKLFLDARALSCECDERCAARLLCNES